MAYKLLILFVLLPSVCHPQSADPSGNPFTVTLGKLDIQVPFKDVMFNHISYDGEPKSNAG